VDAKALGVHLEITNLVIPTLTDSEEGLRDLARWVARNLGKETPLHFSRFWPQHRMRALPPTPAATLDRAREIALAEGLHFVYVGNVLRPEAQDTRCPSCRRLLVEREQFTVLRQEVTPQGRCPGCGAEVYGRWA
jgi:pyruvate formate lyase activating enzyme